MSIQTVLHFADLSTLQLPELCQQRIETLLARGKRQILGIAAPPGAGKSTLVQAVARQYGAAVQVVPMDGFHLANRELERLGRRARKGAPDTFDADGYVALMHRIKRQTSNERIYAPEFRREIEEAIAGAIAIDARTPLILTEGNYLLLDEAPWSGLRMLFDEVWYLDVDEALRHERLLARHMQFGRSRQAALDWIAQTDQPNAVRIAQHRDRADWHLPWN